MKPEKVVVSAEDDSIVIYAEVGGIILGIRLNDPFEAERIADDIRDRASIVARAIARRRGTA